MQTLLESHGTSQLDFVVFASGVILQVQRELAYLGVSQSNLKPETAETGKNPGSFRNCRRSRMTKNGLPQDFS